MSTTRIEFNLSGSWRSGPDIPSIYDRPAALEAAEQLAKACKCTKLRLTYGDGSNRKVQHYWTPEKGWYSA